MSLIILDKTKKAPIYKHVDKPTFKTTLQRDKWLAEEKRRWVEGYQHLPGHFYFFMTQQFLKDRVKGTIGKPLARECDLILHEEIARDRRLGRPTGVFKPRGLGFSSQGGSLAFYNAITNPGANILMTSKETATIKDFFTSKIVEPYEEMDKTLVGPAKSPTEKKYKHPQPVYQDRLNATKSECFLKLGIKHRDHNGEVKTSFSQIITKETASSDKATTGFSGMGGIYGFVDEFALHLRREKFFTSFQECFQNPMTKEYLGHILWGGTCEESLTDAQLLEFKKTYEHFSHLGHNIVFFEYWRNMFLDENGYPDRKRAEKWHDDNLKAREGDETAIKAFLKLHPRSMDDIFDIASSDALEADVINALKEQKKIVIQDNEPLAPVEIAHIGGTTSYTVVKESPVKILEAPKPNISYVTLVDSMAVGTDAGPHEGSDYCALVMKLYDPSGHSYMPVAYYKERPTKVESSYWQTIRLCQLYEQSGGTFHGIMAEASNSTEEFFPNLLINNGLSRYIMNRKDLSGKGNIDVRKSFQPVNNHVMAYQFQQANIFLRKNIGSMRLLPLIDELLAALEENMDMRSAFLMLFCAFPDINEGEVAKATPRARPQVSIVTDAKGNRVRKVIAKNTKGTQVRAGEILKFAR